MSGGGLGLCRPDLEREEGDGASVADDGAHSPATEQVLFLPYINKGFFSSSVQ